ncbi:MAG: hypothetical protein ACXWCG_02430 [Flavitalea sp.]
MKRTKTYSVYSLLLIVLISLTSCLTPRKIDKWIDHEYGNTVQTKPKKSDYITIAPPQTNNDIIAKTEKKKMKMLPLLFYWKWEYGTVSTLNEKVPHNTFQQTFIPYANGKRLKEKLNGQTVELKLDQMPATFSVVDKGGMVFLVLWAISWDRIFVDPTKQDMVVSYRLLRDGVETKKGTITIADHNKPVDVKVLHSVKKTFWEYLATYTGNVQGMSKEVADKLIVELSTNANSANTVTPN